MKKINYFRLIVLCCLLFCSTLVVGQNKKEPIKVACIGNSITYGAKIKNRFQNSYPSILQQMLGEGYDVRNFGVSGCTCLHKGNKPYVKRKEYKEALAFNPDIVTIKLGTNDSKAYNWCFKDEFKDDLKSLISSFESLPSHPKIYLCLPVPVMRPNFRIQQDVVADEVVPMVKQVAIEKNLSQIDLYDALLPFPKYFVDGVHPNALGAEIIAATIYKKFIGKKAPEYNVNQPFPGKISKWNGCNRYDFITRGRHAIVVEPKEAAPGRPWIWRPAFFGAYAYADEALLKLGFHIVYLDVTHSYGNPQAVVDGKMFYDAMVINYNLSKKVTIEGFSRGGYYAFNWAAVYPEQVACLYVDAPVCDIVSWPGRARKRLWNNFLDLWNVKDEEVNHDFKGNVLQIIPKLAEYKIPILGVCGDSDNTVPYSDNLKKVKEAYEKLGGSIDVIIKPGIDHHPHSLKDPEKIVNFIITHQDIVQ